MRTARASSGTRQPAKSAATPARTGATSQPAPAAATSAAVPAVPLPPAAARPGPTTQSTAKLSPNSARAPSNAGRPGASAAVASESGRSRPATTSSVRVATRPATSPIGIATASIVSVAADTTAPTSAPDRPRSARIDGSSGTSAESATPFTNARATRSEAHEGGGACPQHRCPPSIRKMRVDGRSIRNHRSIDGRRDPPSGRARGGRRDGLVRSGAGRSSATRSPRSASRSRRSSAPPGCGCSSGRAAGVPVTPTDAGQRLLRHARRAVGGDARRRGRPPRARRGRGRHAARRHLPERRRPPAAEAMRRYVERWPERRGAAHRGRLRRGARSTCSSGGELDLAFVIANDDPAFERVHVLSDPYVLLAPAASELAQSERPIRPREIARRCR